MFRKISKNLLVFSLLFTLVGFFIISGQALAQTFGTEAVSNGLNNSLTTVDPRTIAGRIINLSLGFLGLIAMGLMLYAGFTWMTAGGNEEKIETAKKILRNAAIGLIIILASWGIATFVLSRLGGTLGGNGGPGGCYEGEISACGCGGSMVCSGGSYGGCIGSDCSGGGITPSGCDASPNPGCQAAAQICSPSDYCDASDCGCKPKGNLGDPCSSDPDQAKCVADDTRCAEYLSCNPSTCTCYGPPVITEISPVGGFCNENSNKSCTKNSDCSSGCNLEAPNGTANNFVTILGKNFGSYSATSSQVIFAASSTRLTAKQPSELNSACINTWRDDQIVVAVPAGPASGPIKVVNSDSLSDTTGDSYGPTIPDFEANNISRPGLCYLNPNRGLLSSEVGYQGINLYSGKAYFGSYENNVRALDSQFNNSAGLNGTSTTPNIRPGDSGSFVATTISGQPEKSNYLRFTKDSEPGDGPFISSFYPTIGNTGQYVTIRGNGFGGAKGTSRVYFGETEAAYDFPDMCVNSVWKNNQIIVKVPVGLVDGYQTISIKISSTTIDTKKLNPNAFLSDKNAVLKSSLCKIEPDRGPAATPVVIWGEYFGKVDSLGLAKFNYDKSATGTIKKDGRADMLKTAVPEAAITGPVRVINNSVWGNELNFYIGECTKDADCGTQVCCPKNTYREGRCVSSLSSCFIDIPNSVFEWSFSTGFSTTTPDFTGSCAGLAQYFGSCQIGATCPNVPGSCSPYAGGGKKVVANCDYNCASISSCGLLGSDCTYNSTIDKCVKNSGSNGACDLTQEFSYILDASAKEYKTTKTCNADRHWEISSPTSCPIGWSKASNNKCVDLRPGSECSSCDVGSQCEKVNSSDSLGYCVSPKLCPSGATCENNPVASEPDRCVIPDQPTCDCCCQIGQDARDCCAPLKCVGTCGADTGKTSGATLGKCGGCKSVGSTPEERDAACNCSGHSGQFCDISNAAFPDGVCTDCSNLSGTDCTDHSSACCLDAKKTATTTDDICRGGSAISSDPSAYGYGYCAYFKCETLTSTPPGDPTKCASSTKLIIGDYSSLEACANDCQEADPCAGITAIDECLKHSRCCFDSKIASSTKCRLGDAITGTTPADNGYCAYYDCQTASSTPPGDPTKCASSTPSKSGSYKTIDFCALSCSNNLAGPGLSCDGQATSTCASDKCNFPGFGCFLDGGNLGTASPNCGTCCCQPGLAPSQDVCTVANPKLSCVADKGSCKGEGANSGKRGLCCGCQADTDCGSSENIGCGLDTCCQARPQITTSTPAHLADKVCRNALIKVNFDFLMDQGSFSDNVLLLEERDYGNGVCPAGTFVAQGDSVDDLLRQRDKNWLARLSENIAAAWSKLAKKFSGTALADLPSSTKLYCSVPGTTYGEDIGNPGTLVFAPQRLLAPAANYYLVIKGDEDLNSKTGVLSASGIGFNGQGYIEGGVATEGALISFNNRSYKNSQIIKFSTLSDQGPAAGICAVDKVTVSPASYLFKTTNNSLDEDDVNVNSKTFDTVADRDKVFTAQAYSASNQVIQPVSGYFWDWQFKLDNTDIAATSSVANLAASKILVSAKTGVTDADTKVTATINMNRFATPSCSAGSCSCLADTNCSNNCCNVYSGGDKFNKAADLYIFVCNNPWPPVGSGGTWSPWVDNCTGSIAGPCNNYNYKFYYCRDAGVAGTLDDLPAILNQPVIRGESSNLICTADKSPCAVQDTPCGPDKNSDGKLDGLCIWNVLKESYFFREAILSGGELISVTDNGTDGAVKVTWRSDASQVASYKVYYLKSGKGAMLSKEVPASSCSKVGTINNCNTIISGLTNNIPYIFKISVISVNKTESSLSSEKSATPTDKTAPAVPAGLTVQVPSTATSTLRFSWTANSDDTAFYRLYHGVIPGSYGESFDSAKKLTSLSFPLSQFTTSSDHYFVLSAVDSSGNESAKSFPEVVRPKVNSYYSSGY